jgi:hypothetical protein
VLLLQRLLLQRARMLGHPAVSGHRFRLSSRNSRHFGRLRL